MQLAETKDKLHKSLATVKALTADYTQLQQQHDAATAAVAQTQSLLHQREVSCLPVVARA